jgi:hypothetical protein
MFRIAIIFELFLSYNSSQTQQFYPSIFLIDELNRARQKDRGGADNIGEQKKYTAKLSFNGGDTYQG